MKPLIIHQTQPCTASCVATCFAMLVNQPAAAIKEQFHEAYRAQQITLRQMLESLEIPYTAFCSIDDPGLVDEGAYLLTVPSLNIVGGAHQALCEMTDEGYFLLDPVQGLPGRRHYVPRGVKGENTTELGMFVIDAFIPRSYLLTRYAQEGEE